MFLSNLQEKDVINTIDGKKIGIIVDVYINENGEIQKLIVQNRKFLFFLGKKYEFNFNKIEKIGKDVILIKFDNL